MRCRKADLSSKARRRMENGHDKRRKVVCQNREFPQKLKKCTALMFLIGQQAKESYFMFFVTPYTRIPHKHIQLSTDESLPIHAYLPTQNTLKSQPKHSPIIHPFLSTQSSLKTLQHDSQINSDDYYNIPTSMQLSKQLLKLTQVSALVRLITKSKVPEAQASIRILIEHSIQLAREKVKQEGASVMRKMKEEVLAAVYAIRMLKARRLHYPIQYLVGEWPFKELTLMVKPPVLIPRFETEYLVEKAIAEIRKKFKKGSAVRFVDLGCGTGAIGLSLIKQLEGQYEIRGCLVDISRKCIDLAAKNAEKNGIGIEKLEFVCADMKDCSALIQASDVIISNPPYLTEHSHKRLQKQVRLYQSHSALVGGNDGLEYVNFLIDLITTQKNKGKDQLCLIQYGGQSLSHLSLQHLVQPDQYNRRRYIILT